MIRFLELSDVLLMHREGIRDFGGIHGTRDENRLDSALNMPKAGFKGEYFHKTIPSMAAAYAFHICQNHPFLDGNKRTATHALIMLLRLNGIKAILTKDDLVKIGYAIASGTMSHKDLADMITERVTAP